MGSTKKPMWPILVGLFMIALIASPLILQMSLIPTGWNTDTNFDRVYVDGTRFNLDTTAAGNDDLFWGHVYSKEALVKPYEEEWAFKAWSESMRYQGTTKVKCTLAGPTEVYLGTGPDNIIDWLPVQAGMGGEPFQYYTKTIGDVDYTYEHRVFEVGLQILTMGESIAHTDAFQGTCDGLPSKGILWQLEDDTWVDVTADQDNAADLEFRIAFNLNRWAIRAGDEIPINDTAYYVVEDEFMGVMSASVIDVFMGTYTGTPTTGYLGLALPTQQQGAQLSLFNFDDSTATSYYSQLTQGDETVLGGIDNVPEGLMFSLSGQIEPGLAITYGAIPGTWSAATPVQNHITWRIRVDVLTALGVRLISGVQPTITTSPTGYQPPPEFPDPIGDFFDAIWDGLGMVGEWFSNPMNTLFAVGIVIIVLVIFAYVFGKSIPFLMPARKVGVSIG